MARDRLSAADKEEIIAETEASGVGVKINKGCRACYDKALAAMYEALQHKDEMKTSRQTAVSRDGYKFKRPGMSFRLGKKLYDENTIADLEVGKLHQIIRITYFVKIRKDGAQG